MDRVAFGAQCLVFVAGGQIVWTYALAMALAAILGALTAAKVGRLIPKVVLRWLVIAIGLGLAIYYLSRQSSPPVPPQPEGLSCSPGMCGTLS